VSIFHMIWSTVCLIHPIVQTT